MSTKLAAPMLAIGIISLAGCFERPPMESTQTGYRGTGMVQIHNSRLTEPQFEIPAALPPVPEGGPAAGEVFQNVQVLGDLSVGEFTRLMTAMTTWVAPQAGCNYCHLPTDLASDDIYTKVVARRMIEMTRHVNTAHADHVGATGITCLTCHRGNNVPEFIWTEFSEPPAAQGVAGWRNGQNMAGRAEVAYTSLPADPFGTFLATANLEPDNVRVVSQTALPMNPVTNISNIKDAEATYSLMLNISESLGVNCTYCHNSRSFASWSESNPARTKAWYGRKMVVDVNDQFLEPLVAVLPEHRLGTGGDAPKAHCGTCHQGQPKPLNGAPVLVDYPVLGTP